MNITQYKLHNICMRTLPLSAVCIERLNALQPKQSCWSEGYLKPKPRTYCHLPDVCLLCVLWSLSLSLQSVPVALFVSEEELMFWCSLVGADRPPCSFRTGRFGVWCPLLGAESDSYGENKRWKGPTSRKVRVCVCVFFPSILDIKFVGRTSRGHTGGRSHRIFNPPSFCGACLDFCREKDSAIPFPRRP